MVSAWDFKLNYIFWQQIVSFKVNTLDLSLSNFKTATHVLMELTGAWVDEAGTWV